jgi:hypothetical protein
VKVYIVQVEDTRNWEGIVITEEYLFSNMKAASACEKHLKDTRTANGINVYKRTDVVKDFFPNEMFSPGLATFSIGGYIDPDYFLAGKDVVLDDHVEFFKGSELKERVEIIKEEGYDSVRFDMIIKTTTRKEAVQKANDNIREFLTRQMETSNEL